MRYQQMKEILERILPLWGIENKQLLQIYSSAWEVNGSYVIKVYDNRDGLERNIKISTILSDCDIPVAVPVPAKTGEKYVEYENTYFLMSEKLKGSSIADIKNKAMAYKMGCAIARLHGAFLKCEKEIEFWDNGLLKEMKGWVRDTLVSHGWQTAEEGEYLKTTELLEKVYDQLPKQLIHRDVHFGNFLFFQGNLSGYIDFDLSQRNIRIFDICYFLTGLLAEEAENAFTKEEWMESIKSVISGYESVTGLSATEKGAVPCVMECIEILFTAYFTRIKDTKQAENAYNIFRFVRNCESDIINII